MSCLLSSPFSLKESHTGDYLAEEVEQCLKTYGIADKVHSTIICHSSSITYCLYSKILGQACDNASNNDTLISELEFRLANGQNGTHTRIRCICHILNLVVKV